MTPQGGHIDLTGCSGSIAIGGKTIRFGGPELPGPRRGRRPAGPPGARREAQPLAGI